VSVRPSLDRGAHAAPRAVVRGALATALLLAGACGGRTPQPNGANGADGGRQPIGVELHEAGGRPRLLAVRREGDPRAGLAIELRVPDAYDDASVRTAALGAWLGARLEALGLGSVEIVAGAHLARVRALGPKVDAALADALDASLRAPIRDGDPAIPAIAAALDALLARPVAEPALARADRCLDRPSRPAAFARVPREKTAALAEGFRVAALRADGLAIGVVAADEGLDAFAHRWQGLEPWRAPAGIPPMVAPAREGDEATIAHGPEGGVLVLEGASRGAIPDVVASLADRGGALSSRLLAAYDWRLRGVAGVSWPEGGCLVIEVEPGPTTSRRGTRVGEGKDWNLERFTSHAAYALEVARQESELALDALATQGALHVDDADAARLAIGRGGDPREAADRAAFWGFAAASTSPSASSASSAPSAPKKRAPTSVLSLPLPAIAKGPQVDVEALTTGARVRFVAALDRARIAWARSELETRSRVEAGQGELWVALGSPCGVAWETTLDAGLARVAIQALGAAVAARTATSGAEIEPWGTTLGVGFVAHAPARAGESSKALAQRLGDLVGRAFLTGFPAPEQVAVVRGEAVAALSDLAPPAPTLRPALHALVPDHPSWIDALGALEPVAKIGAEGVELRLSTLRAGPLRLAVLANADADQVEATSRAAERWVPRLPGETRACPATGAPTASTSPKGALHVVHVAAGTGLALAFPVADEDREAASVLAAALDGEGGRLARDLGPQGLATSYEARLVRGLGRSALVIVVLAPNGNLDAAAAAVRTSLERLRTAGPDEADLARAEGRRAQATLQRRLDPRARVIDLFVGDEPNGALEPAKLRASAARVLAEDHLQLVVARLAK
jgi:hypothetical protein